MKLATQMMVGVAYVVLLAGAPWAAELDGVKFADTAEIGGKTVTLNGLGERKVLAFVKVYVLGLYLEAKTHDAKTAIETDEAKRISMHFVREVPHEKMVGAMENGFKETAPNSFAKEKKEMLGYFTEPLETGDVCNIDYVPGIGTTVTIDGVKKGTIPGADFMRALWGIWLGPNPPGGDALKEGMLGN